MESLYLTFPTISRLCTTTISMSTLLFAIYIARFWSDMWKFLVRLLNHPLQLDIAVFVAILCFSGRGCSLARLAQPKISPPVGEATSMQILQTLQGHSSPGFPLWATPTGTQIALVAALQGLNGDLFRELHF